MQSSLVALVIQLYVLDVYAHLTVTPMPAECKAGGCTAGGYGFYAVAKFAHSKPGNYTYKVSMKIPKLASATIKPQFVPGWILTYNPDTNPDDRWIHYTAYPGMEIYDKWVGMFQLNIAFKCGSATAPLEFDDSLIVPMGTSAATGKTFYGALFPTRQYLCEMVNGKCVPNGAYEEWAGFTSANYGNGTACAAAAEAAPGSCHANCRGSNVPCVSFTAPAASCGPVTIKPNVAFGAMDAPGEGGNFPAASLTRDFSVANPFAPADVAAGRSGAARRAPAARGLLPLLGALAAACALVAAPRRGR
jgi:hypothetical protein